MSRADTTPTSSEGSIDVVVVTQFFPPEGQGGGHRWQKFIQQHTESELNYRVITTPPAYPFGEFDRTYRPWKTEAIDGTPVTRLWTYQPRENAGSIGRILNYGIFAVFATLYMLVNFWRYDIVVTMSTPHTTFLPGAVGKALGRTWIIDIFDLWLDNAADLEYTDKDSLGYQLVAWLEHIAFHHANHIIVLTPTMKRFYLKKYDINPDRLTPIPFGVDRNLFDPTINQESEPYITYVGNLGTFYAFEPYFRAFAQLDEKYKLYIIGWGEERERLETLSSDLKIEDRVIFTGRIPRKDVAEYLASAKLNLVPLKTEYQLGYARPTKMLEGMAVGTPYVASPIKEIQFVTKKGNTGRVAENNAQKILSEMEILLNDDELRHNMGESCIEFIESNHRWDSLASKIRCILVSSASK
ncbi:glycosyltransferase family 4 protein [Halorubrum ezzemoulense]|uniref:glycosyltransferase family 4 protein n=1 Tax=Halorubrum ezzemoulense TaxID=337243 RepID=UPI00232E093F|nr:glycosyltransferase family 4 protein [Halorubrum ezzemoulense]MDB9252927.1 glycosyltransferase family 4 protein [Halorubrum ezzemoulense]MDB9256689.1 glycosyltransferase family 4 protein [Halorubrum ezzemoulense]MDB9276996.1 glycosyltransferase family 4 protein [Halorubrum ezzemoulense]